MKAQVKLFRVFGIQIGLHYSWLPIALLVVLSLSAQFSETNRRWNSAMVWSLAILIEKPHAGCHIKHDNYARILRSLVCTHAMALGPVGRRGLPLRLLPCWMSSSISPQLTSSANS